MILAGDTGPDAPAFWYARVLTIFHVLVVYPGRQVERMDVLHVRWFGHDPETTGGWAARRLERVGWADEEQPNAFSFVNPADVVRTCHMIPAFEHGTTTARRASVARDHHDSRDWNYHYVGR